MAVTAASAAKAYQETSLTQAAGRAMRLMIYGIIVSWLGVTAVGVTSVSAFQRMVSGTSDAALCLLEQLAPASNTEPSP